MDPRVADEVSIADLFDQFIKASTMKNVLAIHHRILNYANLNPCEFNVFFPKLKRAIMSRARKNWKAKAIFAKIDKKAAHRCYANTKSSTTTTPLGVRYKNDASDTRDRSSSLEFLDDDNDQSSCDSSASMSREGSSTRQYNCNNALQHHNCLIIGSGPAGLRTAIELQLLGANRVVVVEKRSRFSRNNVLHLWPFVIDDLKSLGAKKFYGKFCAGSIDHISIRQLQLILLKICLMIGCDFRDNCSYLYLCPSSIKQTNSISNNFNENSSDTLKADGCQTDTLTNTTNKENDNNNLLKCDLDSSSEKQCKKLDDDFVRVSDYLEVNKQQDNDDDKGEQKTEHKSTDSQELEDQQQLSNSILVSAEINDNQDNSISNNNQSDQLKQQPKQSGGRRVGNLRGARAHFSSDFKRQEDKLHSLEWDIIIGADGRRNTLSKFFPRKEFRGRLAIAITANFINRQTPIEAAVPEISGLSFIYNQDMFNALAYDTNIQLENICYYKDDTHYFVMTAKKKSLLERGVLKEDYATTQDLLSDSNVDREALLDYAKDAAYWTTGLEPLEFALNHYGQEDCAMFDFTSMYAALNACKALRTTGGGLSLVTLVGDSLLEPFWPTGSGCARGFLSSFDAAWMCRQWAVNKCATIDHHSSMSSRATNRSSRLSNVSDKRLDTSDTANQPTTYNRMALSVMAERESIYRILGQTTSENLQQNYAHWTLNPHSRYPNLNRHLVMPSQVEHLISDHESQHRKGSPVGGSNSSLSKPKSTRLAERRIKSPNNGVSRKSPKKLKSANASPLGQPKSNGHSKSRSKSLTKQAYMSRSKRELALDTDTYLEFEDSYKNLGSLQYLNHGRPNCDLLDDLFVPSLSGTSPSSNNLMSLEARRARDIDECLRQRRQKTKINVVREQLIERFKGNSTATAAGSEESKTGNAALFQELRKMREQQARGKENSHQLPFHLRAKTDIAGNPLTLLNSMRRCTSFAERVKSFESKLSSFDQQDLSSQSSSQATTPRTPLIDNVKNLPQFATLQELFVGNSTLSSGGDQASATSGATGKELKVKKSKIPITKLSKDDWNVKCWEKRLAAYKERQMQLSGSTKSLNKTKSMDSPVSGGGGSSSKPQKQVEVFQDRIKEMAEKLKAAKAAQLFGNGISIEEKVLAQRIGVSATGSKLQHKDTSGNLFARINNKGQARPLSGSWVSHLKSELTKGHSGEGKFQRPQVSAARGLDRKPAMNPNLPSKPIKKLFEDDADDEDGNGDNDQHYDHLCINRPTNKYLSKSNGYSSHLVRTRYDSQKSIVINRPTTAHKQAYMAATGNTSNTLTSRGSSASITSSELSTATTNSSSNATTQRQVETEKSCFRCNKLVRLADRIQIGEATLHRVCLTCAKCNITLRTNEIQFYLSQLASGSSDKFVCSICEPDIRSQVNRDTPARQANQMADGLVGDQRKQQVTPAQTRYKSREEFFNARIDYNELYKNILDDNATSNNEVNETINRLSSLGSNSRETTPATVVSASGAKKSSARKSSNSSTGSSSQDQYEDAKSTNSAESARQTRQQQQVVLEEREEEEDGTTSGATKYKIARSETIDGSEQVTLILPAEDSMTPVRNESVNERASFTSRPREMIDEEEFERVLLGQEENTAGQSKPISGSRGAIKVGGAQTTDKLESSTSEVETSDENEEEEEDDEDDDDQSKHSEASSSLNSPPNTDEYDDDRGDEDDDDDEANVDSTCGDFATSEEFEGDEENETAASERLDPPKSTAVGQTANT